MEWKKLGDFKRIKIGGRFLKRWMPGSYLKKLEPNKGE